MSAQERNDAVVQANTKQLEVPTFNKKEIEKIVVDTAKKDDVPLGYQIIDINLINDGQDNYTIEERDDSKLLKELLKEHSKKPILLDVTVSTGQHLIGFGCSVLSNNTVKLAADPYLLDIQYVPDSDILTVAFNY